LTQKPKYFNDIPLIEEFCFI